MNESIQKHGDEVAIVIYDAPLPPKYFRLTKKFIRTLFVVAPLVLMGILFLAFSWGLGSRLESSPPPTLPKVMSEADDQVSVLEAKVRTLEKSNEDLAEKLANGPVAAGAPEDPPLLVIKKPYGMQNLLSQNKVALDQFQLSQEAGKTALRFNISSVSEVKVTGHILVFMLSESGLSAYPSGVNQQLSQGVKYSSGEPFSVSRLRPTNAEFAQKPVGASIKFVIYIFSREGDLLLIRETESYKTGPQS